MTDWSSYELSDFLMFSAATYWRLVERLNAQAWPWQLLSVAAGLLLVWMAATRRALGVPVIAGVLALAWLHVGWTFFWQAFAPINWGARYLAWAFAVQGVLLLALLVVSLPGVTRRSAVPREPSARMRGAGLLVALAGVVAYPVLTALIGDSLARAEVAGWMPEPTALATMGLLIATRATAGGWMLVIPALSLVIGWTMLRLLQLQ